MLTYSFYWGKMEACLLPKQCYRGEEGKGVLNPKLFIPGRSCFHWTPVTSVKKCGRYSYGIRNLSWLSCIKTMQYWHVLCRCHWTPWWYLFYYLSACPSISETCSCVSQRIKSNKFKSCFLLSLDSSLIFLFSSLVLNLCMIQVESVSFSCSSLENVSP